MGNTTPSDSELLAEWLKHRRESAFHALVVRYASLVHMAAKRTGGDDALAADASQLVFILLAQKAKSLSSRSSLAGWLHLSAILYAKRLSAKRRTEFRKLQHLYSAMEPSTDSSNVDSWTDLQPVLDAAIASLSEKDREAVLLRFYRSLSVREVASTLGIATDAAQKRLDRATERLREKLTRRGVNTSASLSAVMLAGYASEANAAPFSTSVLSSKAIAASAITPTGIFATLIAMKATSYVAPAIVLLCSGWFLNHQTQAISQIRKETTHARTAVTAHASMQDRINLPAKVAVPVQTVSTGPIDWSRIAKELSQNPLDAVTNRKVLEPHNRRVGTLSREELVAAWDAIVALECTPEVRAALVEMIMLPLGRLDPGIVVSKYWESESRLGQGAPTVLATSLFMIWAGQDAEKAGTWLDAQAAARNAASSGTSGIDGALNHYQAILAESLLGQDPASASRRLGALPPEQRASVMQFIRLTKVPMELRTDYATLVRSITPKQRHGPLIARSAFPDATIHQNDLPQVAEFLQRISATAEELRAVIDAAARRYSTTMENNHASPPTREDYDLVRAWVQQLHPPSVDSFTATKLNEDVEKRVLSSHDAARMVQHYHEQGAGDELISNFLTKNRGLEDSTARELASQIRDAQLRVKALERINP